MSNPFMPTERPHVLVVERDVSAQLFIRNALEDVCETYAAYTASMAYAQLLERPFDLVITSVELPGSYMGHDVLEVVRTLPEYRHKPVIVIASNGLTEEEDDYLAQGFAAHFPSLPPPEELRATIVRALDTPEEQLLYSG